MYTAKQRLVIYRRALKVVEGTYERYKQTREYPAPADYLICEVISQCTKRSKLYPTISSRSVFLHFDELAKRKPLSVETYGPWWTAGARGMQIRIRVLKSIIREMEKGGVK